MNEAAQPLEIGEPTAQEMELVDVATCDFAQVIEQLVEQGFPPKVIVVGFTCAITQFIATRHSLAVVPTWFWTQAVSAGQLCKARLAAGVVMDSTPELVEIGEPTEQEMELAHVAYSDFAQAIEQLVEQGLPPKVIMVGFTCAITEFIANRFSLAVVPTWFWTQAVSAARLCKAILAAGEKI